MFLFPPHIVGIKNKLMKKCILMFTLLVLALVVAVLLENDSEIVSDKGLLLSENSIENISLDK
ncbi:hypothetical protein FB2170_05015 [Maribacter sp. HTCC2170]|nr:hypothetical protein FB2170_05015 [Maribacter sp. HTCC2170]